MLSAFVFELLPCRAAHDVLKCVSRGNMGKIAVALTSLIAIVTAAPRPLAAQATSPDSTDYKPSYQLFILVYE
jgi:hypothetical protein